jgi:paraquat-inducible protein B
MNEEHRDSPGGREGLPQAKIKPSRARFWIWLVPVVAAALVGWWVYQDFARKGPTITIRFQEAKGLTAGQADVRYRGATIGRVRSLQLTPDEQGIIVKAELDKSAAGLAVEGSEFWIVRPELSAAGVKGLMTIVSGEYIHVKPGAGKRRTEFTGLEQPPVITGEGKGLKLVLWTDKVGSLGKGSPVYYREMQVGEVMAVRLADHGNGVSVPVWIDEQYAPLVGSNSKFWKAGGLNLQMSLAGISLSAESVKALINGGIAFANPNGIQEPAKDGANFQLHESVLPEWLGFAPTNRAGSRISIHFKNGDGLLSGQSEVQYLGVKVGEVREVTLAEQQQGVTVIADLGSSAANLAREGSLFWVVRPQISAGSVRGLQTIGSGDFIQVQPGNGKPAFEFAGSEEPPPIPVSEPGLVVVLVAEKLGAVQTGSPVFYRGIKAGKVIASELGPESQVVNIRAWIDPHYVPLVRRNSKFWNAGGINVDIGLFGADIQAKSFKTLISGGIAFATPDAMEEPAPGGTPFRLYDKPEDQWLGWAPAIQLPPEAR